MPGSPKKDESVKLYNGLTAHDRIQELEENISEAECIIARLEAKIVSYKEMEIEYKRGGFHEVINNLKAEIERKEEARAIESRDKAENARRAKYWQDEAMKLGWSKTRTLIIE